jgi:hypothetical protein
MDAIQKLNDAIAKVAGGNDLYDTYKDTWQYLLESYIGGEEYRRANHLVRYQLETEPEYQARLRTTPLENHCASVISVYNSFLFRTEPKRDLGSIENLAETEDFMRDADFDGRSLDNFMKDVATWTSVFGHAWVVVSKPNINATTRGDEVEAGVRPYLSVLTPLVVLDWEWSRSPSGRYQLNYFKYLEDVNKDVHTVKEWTNDVITTTVIDMGEETITDTIIEPNGLGKIPAVCVYNKKGVIKSIGISDIADIADAQRFIYNATSEIDQSIRLDSHPSLVKTPETNAGIGAGSIIHMPENLDPGLKPYILEFSGASVDKILGAIQHQVGNIDKMANTGAVRATESRVMSGIAMETEFQLLNAKLSEKADQLELAEEQIWKLFCEYMGYAWNGDIDYPGSFNIRDTGSEIAQLKTAAETSPNDPQIQKGIAIKVAEWMELEYDEDEVMPTTTPEDRPQHMQEMIMGGYEDAQILALHPEVTQNDINNARTALLTNQGE